MDTTVWSTPAMGMVPTAETVREDKYVTTAGRVKFKVGQAGKITFVAAIPFPLPKGQYVLRAHLERKVPDLFGTEILLRRARHAGGNVETLLKCVGVQGAIGDPQNNVRFSDSESKSLEVDLNEHYYWVQVTDVNATVATVDSVDAVVGVGLIRVQ
jgi:hypothetical protein